MLYEFVQRPQRSLIAQSNTGDPQICINNCFALFATHFFTKSVDRDELFEKARGEILDEVINLSLVSSQTWEDAISKKLWQKVAPFVFENIYLPAAAMTSDSPERPISTYNKTGKNLPKVV